MSATNLVLWGHTIADYQEMFDLTATELDQRIIDCCPGPASFNADMALQHKTVIATDPMFSLELPVLKSRINDEFQAMLHRVQIEEERFNWEKISSPDELARIRQQGINHFFKDFSNGLAEGRYLAEDITKLSFDDFSFDIAVCSHYLFGGRSDESVEFHLQAIEEMARVAAEVRIFPLVDSHGETSPLVGPILLALQQQHYGAEVRSVPYQFQKKGNAMLRVWAHKCDIQQKKN